MKVLGIFVLAFILTSACSHAFGPRIKSKENGDVNLGAPFVMGYKDTATISEINLTIRFDEILEDSRCPSSVNCVWSGIAKVGLSVWSDSSRANHLVLASADIPPDNSSTYIYQGYQIELKAIDPYPEYPGESIDKNIYRLTLVISQAN